MQRHRLGVMLTTMSREDHSTLCDMAVRTDEGMVLDARNAVLDHVRQDQLNAARRTTHCSHSDQHSFAERAPVCSVNTLRWSLGRNP